MQPVHIRRAEKLDGACTRNCAQPLRSQQFLKGQSVHARMTADLKWYDISDADIQAWFDQLHPETYARRRGVAQFVRQRMAQIIALLDEGEARYHGLVEGEEAAGRGSETGEILEDDH